MQKLKLDDGTLVFLSEETRVSYENNQVIHQWEALKDVIGATHDTGIWTPLDQELRSYIDEWNHLKRKGTAVLDAHGHRDSQGEWLYLDDEKLHKVSDWVESNDGRYGCLVLLVCDELSDAMLRIPKTAKSLMLVPDGPVAISLETLWGGAHHWSLYHPRKGEIDGYTVEYERKQLASRQK